MNIIAVLISLVVLGIGLGLLYRILVKILPKLGIDQDWIAIIMGIIGLIVLVAILSMIGWAPSWMQIPMRN